MLDNPAMARLDEGQHTSLAGLGACLPDRLVSNEELGRLSGIRSERIQELFDVETRYWTRAPVLEPPAPRQLCSDLAAGAAARALADAGISAREVDTLIAVTSTPESVSPPLDYLVRTKIGAGELFGMTLHSACTGIFRAAALVESLVATGRSNVALVVAANAISPMLPFGPEVSKDLRLSGVLYADGAAAYLAVARDSSLPSIEGIAVSTTDSSDPPGITLRPRAGSSLDDYYRNGRPDMEGSHDFRRVLRHGSRLARRAADAVVERLDDDFDDVSCFLTHQATGNLKGIAESVGIPGDKLPTNIDRVGNTIAPSILILLDQLKREGRFSRDDLLVLHTAESATWSYGGMALRWR